jgi:hypothetical protein
MNEKAMIKIFFRCRLPAYSIQPRMHTDKPNAAIAATTDFGLRRESRRAGATPLSQASCRTKSGVAAALCHRSPKVFRVLKLYRDEIYRC